MIQFRNLLIILNNLFFYNFNWELALRNLLRVHAWNWSLERNFCLIDQSIIFFLILIILFFGFNSKEDKFEISKGQPATLKPSVLISKNLKFWTKITHILFEYIWLNLIQPTHPLCNLQSNHVILNIYNLKNLAPLDCMIVLTKKLKNYIKKMTQLFPFSND